MLKILHVIPSLHQASGPTSFCVNVCNQMADERTSLTILHGGKVDETCSKPTNPQVRLINDGDFSQIEVRPDIIHVHALWAPLAHRGVQYARRHKIQYLISTHGMLAPWALKHKWLKKKIAWWLYQRNDLAHASMFHVTATTEIKWLRALGFGQPCVLAPLGSDIPDIGPAVTRRPRDIRTVLFVGRIYPVKGLNNLLNAWASLKASAGPRQDGCDPSLLTIQGGVWQLILAGPDQAGHKAELLALANALGLTVSDQTLTSATTGSGGNGSCHETPTSPPDAMADVVFTGPVYGAEKQELYNRSDLFVLPSFTENFGVVVTDALASGIPVITTKGTPWEILQGNSGSSEVLNCERAKDASAELQNTVRTLKLGNLRTSSGRCGWWIDIGVEPLAKALLEAMSLSDTERRWMGENGRRLVQDKYSWTGVAARMEEGYARLLSQPRDSMSCN